MFASECCVLAPFGYYTWRWRGFLLNFSQEGRNLYRLTKSAHRTETEFSIILLQKTKSRVIHSAALRNVFDLRLFSFNNIT